MPSPAHGRAFKSHGDVMQIQASLSRVVMGFVAFALTVSPMVANASTTDNGELTAGLATAGCPPRGTLHVVGFISSGSLGSYSPAGLTGGESVWAIDDYDPVTCGSNVSIFSATGFASNPSSSWLISITCNGVERTGSSAVQYSYTSATGVAAWTFDGHFGFANGDQYACAITHS
jgi:hypothetical protein